MRKLRDKCINHIHRYVKLQSISFHEKLEPCEMPSMTGLKYDSLAVRWLGLLFM
jgi:hypothetical protein